MYHQFVERRVRAIFRQLSAGDYEPSVRAVPAGFTHTFPGDHALGGVRHTADGMRRWFERLYTIFPDLTFEVQQVWVRGGLGETAVAATWVDRATPPDGVPYINQGMHHLRLHRGQLVELHAILDTQKVAAVCDRLAAAGLLAAAAPPIDEEAI